MVVACCGTFDGLHEGHKHFLKEAAKFGDLTVFVVSDQVVWRSKHKACCQTQHIRILMLREFGYDAREIADDKTQALKQIKTVQPNLYCLGGDQFTALDRQIKRTFKIVRIPKFELEKKKNNWN